MDIQSLLLVLEKYGVGGLISLASIFLVFSIVKSDWFGRMLGKLSDKFVDTFTKNKKNDAIDISESNIVNHDIFNYIDFWMYSKVPTMKFASEYKTQVFRKYLSVYLGSYKKKINEFVNSKDYQTMDDAKILKALLDLINQVIHDYENEMANSGIPKLIIEKMKFKNNDTIVLTIDLIEGICNSRFYKSENNLLTIYSVLNILLSVLENTITSSEGVCNAINGDLKGMKITINGKTYLEP